VVKLMQRSAAIGSRISAKQTGVTLIELLVVVAIVGILAAVAYPSYLSHIATSSRAEVKGILLETAQFLERNYTTNNCYHRTDGVCATATATVALPFATSPKTGTAKYNITVVYNADLAADCTTGQCFTLSAAPTGSMTGDSCGTLTLDQANRQGAGGAVADCWQR
jgi:type IV pilus assembly protein PilE